MTDWVFSTNEKMALTEFHINIILSSINLGYLFAKINKLHILFVLFKLYF